MDTFLFIEQFLISFFKASKYFISFPFSKQKEITAGGSGPVCSALVNYSYIFKQMKEKKLKKVLLITTGALFNPTFLFQKQSILGIAHAVSFEVVK